MNLTNIENKEALSIYKRNGVICMDTIKIEQLQEMYLKMQDELSKKVFMDRLCFLVGEQEQKVAKKLIYDNEYVKPLIENAARRESVVIFGAGTIGERIARLFPEIKVECFVDNYVEKSNVAALNVYKAADYIKNNAAKTYVISPKFFWEKIERQLHAAGIKSNQIINIGKAFLEAEKNQYFDLPFLEWENKECFVDCGCFDGTTSKILSALIGSKLKKIYAFEPMQNNAELCRQALEECVGTDYQFINKGIWDKEAYVYTFMAAHGQFVMTEQEREDSFKTSATFLDKELSQEKITFIKMDIEGAELPALIGAKDIITKQRPKLAICVYHKVDDFYRIPEYILSLNPEYKLYMRHYGATTSETVLYALP